MDLTGIQLDKYHVVERLDTGGMAEVYKAYQPALDRYVAVKVIASDLGHDPAFLDQFEREARTLARLEHPNILPIYDSGRYGDTPYLVTQYVREGTLAERLGHPLTDEEAVRIVCQVGDALSYAHAMGIIHRDVKPSNVLFTKSGSVLLADFGIAQTVSQLETTDDPGAGSGTPAYMAPEQRAGKPVDSRADIYAMGVLLYELLTGKRAGEQTLLTRSLSATRIPAPLRKVIACATVTHPDDRYEVAEDFVAAVQGALFEVRGEYAESPTLAQQALEAVVIAMLTVVGLGLGLYGLNQVIRHHQSLSIWMGAFTGAMACLLSDGLLIFRDRTRSISLALLGAIGMAIAGSVALTLPLTIAADFLPYMRSASDIIGLLLFSLPGVLLLLAAAGLYAYDHRRARAAVRRNVPRTRQVMGRKSPTSAARRARFITRTTRNEVLKAMIWMIMVGAAARVLAYFAPAKSMLAILASVLQYGLIYISLVLGVTLIVWYTYSKITAASDAPTGQMPSQVLSDVEARVARLEKACEYQSRINEAVAQARAGPLRERLQAATRRLDEWVAYIERLTVRLNELERDPVIRRDRSTVPRAVHTLEARLTLDQDTDTGVKDAVRQTLAARQSQLRHLRALERVMTRAELHCEETIAALGTIYSQVLLVDARDIQGLRAQRLRADIDEQVQVLQDLLNAMDKVQEYRHDALA